MLKRKIVLKNNDNTFCRSILLMFRDRLVNVNQPILIEIALF